MTSSISLERIEFTDLHIKCNTDAEAKQHEGFCQLKVDFSKYHLYHKSSLSYPSSEVSDPRHFALSYGVKLESKEEDAVMPYDIEIEAIAFLEYEGELLQGADRFRAVRMSGYQILHGAVREMIATQTARFHHGLLQLPARNFNLLAKNDSEQDEVARTKEIERQNKVKTKTSTRVPSPKRRISKKDQ